MRKPLLTLFLLAGLLPAGAPAALAATGPSVDSGDTAFIIICTALVMLMTPALAFFYGGMVRQKNVLSTMMHSFMAIAMVSLIWVLYGYSLAFGPDIRGLIGAPTALGLKGVGMLPNETYAATIPELVFVVFQLMFAIITTAIISGAYAERMRFTAFLLFSALWVSVVYLPLAHWVWGDGGWLRQLGALDFAGGTVVHISSGVSGLVAALVLGRRKGLKNQPPLPHNLPFTVLGASLLWFGWFGFNAGSALGSNGLAAMAFLVTNTAAAAAALAWLLAEWLHHGKPTVLGAASGAIAGLVAITPAAGFVTPLASLLIGLGGGLLCYLAVAVLKQRLGYDDALDAFGCHGVGGMWGALATGLFATKTVNELGADGLLYGNPHQLLVQLIGVAATIAFAVLATWLLLKLVGLLTELRVSPEEEEMGLDITVHGEKAYRENLSGSPLPGASNSLLTHAGVTSLSH